MVPEAKVNRTVKTAQRRYVPIEDDPTVAGSAPEGAAEAPVNGPAKPSMHEVFGPGGFLEKCIVAGFDRSTVSSDYEYRPAQLEMAELVHDAFESHHHAIVEAGTGTGKTLAYLLPAICSGRRVVISTATKSLQEQLYQKDIPFLQKHFAPNLKVAVMKGRANFLCISKLNQMADQGLLKGMEELDAFRQIKDWAKLTETGDRGAHLPARRLGALGEAGRETGHLYGQELPVVQSMFCNGDAPARAGSRPDYCESPFVLCGPGAETG